FCLTHPLTNDTYTPSLHDALPIYADHPSLLKTFPPFVYKTQPITEIKMIRDGTMSFTAVKKVVKSPFVTTSNAPTNPNNTQNNVNPFGRCLLIIQAMMMEIIGINDSIMVATIVPGSPNKSCPQKMSTL